MTEGALETWRLVQEQLQFADMPPAKKQQPEPAERAAVLAWIRGELLKTQEPGALAEEKLTQPQFGNYVDHAALFGQRRSHAWHLHPRACGGCARRFTTPPCRASASASPVWPMG